MNDVSAVNYELLRTFVVCGGFRTFAEAARSRRISVSAISQQIRALEAQLGVVLYERIGRGVRLTEAGTGLWRSLRESLADIDEALAAAVGAGSAVRGPLAIGAPRAFGAHWLRPRLPPLLAAYPELRIHLELGVPSLLERRLADGQLDLAVLSRAAELGGIASQAIFTETFVAVAAPAYLARWGAPHTVADFRRHRYLVFDADLAMHAPWWRAWFGRKSRLPEAIVASVASLDEMRALAEAAVAIAVLPDYHVAASVAEKRLRILTPTNQSGRQRQARGTIFLAWRASTAGPAKVRAVRDYLTRLSHAGGGKH